LYRADRVVLEDVVFDIAADDVEEFGDQLVAFFLGNVGLQAQTLPELLGALDRVGVGLCGFALLG